jgi:hypothetical protein
MMGLFVLAYAGDMVAESPINRGVCGSLLSSASCRDLQEWILSPLGLSRRLNTFCFGTTSVQLSERNNGDPRLARRWSQLQP